MNLLTFILLVITMAFWIKAIDIFAIYLEAKYVFIYSIPAILASICIIWFTFKKNINSDNTYKTMLASTMLASLVVFFFDSLVTRGELLNPVYEIMGLELFSSIDDKVWIGFATCVGIFNPLLILLSFLFHGKKFL